MLILLVLFAVAALVVRSLASRLGPRVFLLAALAPLAGFVHAMLVAPAVLSRSPVVEHVPWIRQLDLAITLRMDTLSWVLALVVTSVGALVLVYCARYFDSDDQALGRFAGFFTAFAGSMYGLVVADDMFLLFVFWEATTVFSYLLIGHSSGSRASRGAALQALLVTTFGGLLMLVGFVLLYVEAGTSRLSELSVDPSSGVVVAAVMLVLVGAISKSALVPFHFWLPAAMAAPTPVSAYLHAAAMVKAGIYLIARFAPEFAETPGWRETLVVVGVATMLVGAYRALRQFDLKLVLAYGTVSQLGFLAVVVGYGTRDAALAGLALLFAHALFKATLFLVVGIIDHGVGTRDLRKISGLGREAPVLAVVAAVAAASMAGLPPTVGFVAKEAVFTALLGDAIAGAPLGVVALVGVGIGSALTVAYTARFVWGAFARKDGVERTAMSRPHPAFLAAPLILSAAGLLFGPLSPVLDGWLTGYSGDLPTATAAAGGDVPAEAYHLALWHGLEPALGISAIVIALGATIHAARGRVAKAQDAVPAIPSASDSYWAIMRGIDRTAIVTTSRTQTGSLPFYLGVILVVLVGAVTTALIAGGVWPDALVLWNRPVQLAIAAVIIVGSLAATIARTRFQAAVLVGVTGFGMSVLFAMHGAPDLALTQLLVEAVTLVALVLVLRRLPAKLGTKHGSTKRAIRAVIAAAVGTLMAVVAVVTLGSRVDAPISLELPRLAVDGGHGRNVVNVTLVDIRGWDTMGELSVIIAAATGVASLVFLRSRADDSTPRPAKRSRRLADRWRTVDEPVQGGSFWLLAGGTQDPRERSILLEVSVRLIFHAMIVVSVYLLFAGHNYPGGGFAGGLVAGLALVARYLAGGRIELGAAAPIGAGRMLALGMLLAAGAAVVPLLFGVDALTSTWWEADVWLFGHVEFVTSTIFDIGVYFVVIGLVLDVLRSLGAELDRQREEEVRS